MSANQAGQKAGNTRLGRAVRSTPGVTQRRSEDTKQQEPARQTNSLRDVILGGQDGLVNILGIILGIVAAHGSTPVLITTGFAAAITESISMGAVAYTSSVAERDFYRAAQARESQEIQADPETERAEVREIYASKGFEGELLDRVVDTITANRDVWLNTMLDEELHLEPVETSAILRSSAVVAFATLVGHLIPLIPFLFLARTPAVIVAILASGLVLFGVGVYSAKTLVGDWRISGAQMVAIGLGAAGLGFLVGHLFQTVGA